MTKAPLVFFPENSSLKKQLQSIPWKGITVGPLDIDQLIDEAGRAHALVLGYDEAESVWNEVEARALDLPLYPVIVGNDGDRMPEGTSALLRLSPVLKQPIEDGIQGTIRNLLQSSGWLYRELAPIDPHSEMLIQNSGCEWTRCSVGVVGIVRITSDSLVTTLNEQLELLRLNAYAAIDRVPTARLSTDDLWTLLLVVAVPWTRIELNSLEEESATLRRFVGDTSGSRKLIMCSDESVKSMLGPVAGNGSLWFPTSDNPLRDQMVSLVKSPEELQALEVLFNKRLSAADFDQLVSILGKRP